MSSKLLFILLLCIVQNVLAAEPFSCSFKITNRIENRILANGIVQYESGSLSAISNHNKSTIYISNNSLLTSNNNCIPFPIDSVLLNLQIPIKIMSPIYDSKVNTLCKANDAFHLTHLFGIQYLICMDRKTNKPKAIIGTRILIEFQQLSFFKPSAVMAVVHTKVSAVCKQKKIINPPPAINDGPWFLNSKDSCGFEWIRDAKSCLIVDKLHNQKICIFLHGVGNSNYTSGPPTNSYVDYWGRVNDYTPQCSERYFIHEETKMRGWDNIELQKAYCKLALIDQPKNNNIIQNKILFVHSMGNLILAAAIKNGYCDIEAETTSWYDIQGPFMGSKAVVELQTICLFMHNGDWIYHFSPWFIKWIATTGGYCVPNSNSTYPAYKTMQPDYIGLDKLKHYAVPFITGSVCGYSSFGLLSMYSLPLLTLSHYVNYSDYNDGMVPLQSCRIDEQTFSSNHNDLFYEAAVNHSDGTCRNGDSLWFASQQPCSYYINKS